jgi:2-polyprenyl-6-hydroxyphenyl methylase/3-demethylubiquinone-9 3-methyltransferase
VTEGSGTTLDPAQVAHFDAAATEWWNANGAARWLHKYNAVRVPYIRDAACRCFRRDPGRVDCLHGLDVLDIGCGAGVLCEPLARLGASVVGADPGHSIIEEARRHARQSAVEVDYRCTTAEALADAGKQFDVVLAMEVIEHVTDSDLFVQRCAELVRPGGLIIISTINRTIKSLAFAIIAAEYVLRLLPRGAHQWTRFRKPAEIESSMESHGLRVLDVSGVTLNLFTRTLQLSRDTAVNYILAGQRQLAEKGDECRPGIPHGRLVHQPCG